MPPEAPGRVFQQPFITVRHLCIVDPQLFLRSIFSQSPCIIHMALNPFQNTQKQLFLSFIKRDVTMDIQFLIISYLFQKAFPSQLKTYGEIRAEMVHPSAAVLQDIILFIYGEKVFRLVFLPEPYFHPIGKIAGPAGGQRTGRIAVYRHLIQNFPVIVSQHFHPVYPAVLMGNGFKGEIRKIQESMIIDIQIAEMIYFFFIYSYFILMQLLNLPLDTGRKNRFFRIYHNRSYPRSKCAALSELLLYSSISSALSSRKLSWTIGSSRRSPFPTPIL